MKKYLLLSILTVLLAVGLLIAPQANAATFNKNRLIDDGLFIDTDSMSVAEIQQFLEEEGGGLLANWVDDVDMRRPSDNCVVHKATGMTAAEIIYEASTAWNAQIVENCSGTDVSYWGDADYSNYTLPTVSPKVLLVTLQKEQSLISATGTYSKNTNDYKNPPCCSSNTYKLARATGYGVPDSGGINEQYLGFYNQINWAAWQLRYNFERAGGNVAWDEVGYKTFTGPFIEGTWRRCAGCPLEDFDGFYQIDGSPLYMENRATASLYYYTPHTYPGFFGNYNFVQFYSDWFGSVYADYRVRFHSYSGNPTLKQGEQQTLWIKYENIGGSTWYDNIGKNSPDAPVGTRPVRLATSNPDGRKSIFAAPWGSKNRASGIFHAVYESDGVTMASSQNSAEPGQIVEFRFDITAPLGKAPGSVKEYLRPIVEGTALMNRVSSHFTITVQEALYKARFHSQSGYPSILQGQEAESYIQYTNVGNVPWYDNTGKSDPAAPSDIRPVRLATSRPLGRASQFGELWNKGKNRAAGEFASVYESDGVTLAANQHVVEPGQIARFEFTFKGPLDLKPGSYKEYISPILEGFPGKFPTYGSHFKIDLGKAVYSLDFDSQSAYPTLAPGDSSQVFFAFMNTGNKSWYDDIGKNDSSAPEGQKPIRLATNRPLGRASDFGLTWGGGKNRATGIFQAVYESDGVSLASNQNIVEPGQIGVFEFTLSTPLGFQPGVYKEYFTPVLEGSPGAMPVKATHLIITVP